jgi:hypothetical protein
VATNYPASLDTFDSIASDKKTSDSVGGRTHRDMHNDLGDAIEAVQAELGTDPAGDYATVKARLAANPFIGSGTGSPEGAVTGSPGQQWLQTNATTDVKGWILWRKASGTGNTGWVVGPEADTGTRNLNGVSWSNGWAPWGATGQRIRRIGSVVDVELDLTKAAASADTWPVAPHGAHPLDHDTPLRFRVPVSASGPTTQPVLPVPLAFRQRIQPFTSVVALVCNHC